MEDKVKQFRDQHQVLDMAAGFIPGVGEAQDAHDFYHAAKNKDLAGMSLALIGLGIPFVGGSQIGHFIDFIRNSSKRGMKFSYTDGVFKMAYNNGPLPENFKKTGWTIDTDGAWKNKDGIRFIKDSKGKLVSERTYIQLEKNNANKLKEAEKIKKQKQLKRLIANFNKKADEFGERTGYRELNTQLWQSGVPEKLKMNDEQLKLYITKGAPTIMKHIEDLYAKGKHHDGVSYAVRKVKGVDKEGNSRTFMEVFYPQQSLKLQGNLANKYNSGWRRVDGDEFEYYLLSTSPNARKNLFLSGMPMFRGINNSMFEDLKNGSAQGWFTNKSRNTHIYMINPNQAGTKGYSFMAAPVKQKDSYIEYITGSKVNPSSNHWGSEGMDWIGNHIAGNKYAINITENEVFDSLKNKAERGIWTVLGDANQIKILKGGTGLYDPSFSNPLLRYGGTINNIIGL